MRSSNRNLQLSLASLIVLATAVLPPSALAGTPSPKTRDVQYFAISDPQFFDHKCCNANGDTNPTGACAGDYHMQCPEPEANALRSERVARNLNEMLTNDANIRGIVVAGDLTQRADYADEYSRYVQSWFDPEFGFALPYVFEGLGNHDYGLGGYLIRNEIRTRARAAVCNHGPAGAPPLDPQVPHYSWDWHDVHFVQLNLMPANDTYSGHPDVPLLDPGNALTFLNNDLATHVGNSGRPVVLIHHYGLDCFSRWSWWSDAQRQAYWDALNNYNVALIITGHNHLGASTNCWFWWNQVEEGDLTDRCSSSSDLSGGDPSVKYNFETIDTVDVAATLFLKHTKVNMGPHNMTTVEVFDQNDGRKFVHHFIKGKAIYVENFAPVDGDGSPNYPWSTVQDAVAGVNAIQSELDNDSSCVQTPGSTYCSVTRNWQGDLKMRIHAGTYPEAVTFDTKMRVETIGGSVTIGMP